MSDDDSEEYDDDDEYDDEYDKGDESASDRRRSQRVDVCRDR